MIPTIESLFNFLEDNSHGHVFKRDDGLLARCGGPALCSGCKLELEILKLIDEATSTIRNAPQDDNQSP